MVVLRNSLALCVCVCMHVWCVRVCVTVIGGGCPFTHSPSELVQLFLESFLSLLHLLQLVLQILQLCVCGGGGGRTKGMIQRVSDKDYL